MRQIATRRRGVNGKAERSNELAKIHIAKAQLGLDDETYRHMIVAQAKAAQTLQAVTAAASRQGGNANG